MTETDKTPSHKTSFKDHPLYQTAMEQLATGEEQEAIENLDQLAEIYPDEQELADLRARAELKAALNSAQYETVGHRQPQPFLRQILMILLTVTLALCGIASVFALYERYVKDLVGAQTQEDANERLMVEGQQALAAGNVAGARNSIEELLRREPGHPGALQVLPQIEAMENLSQLYVRAVEHMRSDEWQAALDILFQIEAQSPGFKDVGSLIELAREQLALQEMWVQVPAIRQAEDWQRLVEVLEPISRNHPDFHTEEVKGLLFEAYVAMARRVLAQANADPAQLNEAIHWLDLALKMRPADQNLSNERRMANRFVRGSNLYAQGDAIGAVGEWTWIWEIQPDYQAGVLREKLSQAYPQAARDKVNGADGEILELYSALEYLDMALIFHPGDEELLELRRLVVEYVTGAEAFVKDEWNVAIAYWGPINVIQPGFQGGVLSKNLREACANSTNPNETYCSP